MEERLWSSSEVAEFLGVPLSTLHRWAHFGQGPLWFKVGRHRRYDPDDVRAWLSARRGAVEVTEREGSTR